ncbi:SEL1-like repeat protein [Wohlfahrtiimonas chitiniclastica]|uniref:SEL1-like repeat protein n=1 Tax=Wohlfahrtiimonas chitiniclastica TaxID=400946 RepID=UPI001BCC6028|nr:SEL1-like repeat protein [Wohlfahrtiimonas chitiniclastica]MBS7827784.1 SEL1-like repeat protein [Wohlfahrtiimonas chitiniclastica]
MRNSTLLIGAYAGIAGFFLYMTLHNDGGEQDYLSDIVLTKANDAPLSEMPMATHLVVDEIDVLDVSLSDDEWIDEAEVMLASNDPSEIARGLGILNRLAKDNQPRANELLAIMYDQGIRLPKDATKAFDHYERAALHGSENANIYLFNHYLDHPTPSDQHYQKARDWFIKATEFQRNPIADYGLAYMYEVGLGVPVDLNQALKYYQNAADENFPLAYERLGNLYLQENDRTRISEALLLFQRAANEDMPSAQYKLGYLYEEGLGTKQDYETAQFWYQKAANNQFPLAEVALGRLYEHGFGVEKDNRRAYDYYRSAAEAGNIEAQNCVARAFERGIGVDKDLERAIYWYGEAAQKNDSNAQYNLGRIFEEYPEVRNLDEAKAWYQKAVKANVTEAQTALERLSTK